MFYILINEQGIIAHKVSEMLTLWPMLSLVFTEDEIACIKIQIACYYNYSDRAIVMVCRHKSLTKDCEQTCYTFGGDVLYGQILVLAKNDNNDFALLSPEQVEIVKRETKLIRKSEEI